MFVCCKDAAKGCNGVPDCKCTCSGCRDEQTRFSYEGPEGHDDTCDCDNCTGDDVDHEDEADDEGPTPDEERGNDEAAEQEERRHAQPVVGCECRDCLN